MAINTKTFTEIVRDQVVAMQVGVQTLLDFAVGTILRAMVESNAAVAMWLQGLVLQLLLYSRAATCTGADLDSWLADFGFTRLAATSATGAVTFSRFTSTLGAVVLVGTQVETADGTLFYTVTTDSGNAAYDANQGGYVIQPGTSTVTVPVQATASGAASNVAIGVINTLSEAIPGVDTVSNPASLTNGTDGETDSAARARFVQFILSLAKGTETAIGFAISSLQSNLTYTLTENKNFDGTDNLGYFYAVVDDGTGDPSNELLASVANAIDKVRAFTVGFGVFRPSLVNATISLTATIADGYDAIATKAIVQAAIIKYVNSLALGVDLPYTRLAQIAYDASPGVSDIESVVLNGGTAKLTNTASQIIKTSSGLITVN